MPLLAFSQMRPGRYLIKLATNNKAMHNAGGNRVTIQDACPNYAVNCNNQIWDVKSVRGNPILFTIQMVYNRQFITFKEIPNQNQIYDDVFMEPQKPLASSKNQSFYIRDAGDGKYTIQPNFGADSQIKDPPIDVYLAPKVNSINVEGSSVAFEYKNQALNPQYYNDLSNVFFTFFSVPLSASAVIVRQQVPSVLVAPKSDNKLDVDLKTGSDNLEVRSFQENLEIRIIIQNQADVVLKDANKNQSWPNNSIRRITFPLPSDITVDAIKEIHIYRKQLGSADNFKATTADNWNLQSISATATLVSNGVKSKIEFEKIVSTQRGKPLFKFIYERGDNEFEGTVCKKAFTIKTANSPATPAETIETSNAVVNISVGTGGDDLRGGNDNAKVVFSFKSKPQKISIQNIFRSANLPNFSERNKTIEMPNTAGLDISDIKEIELHHSGGGGIGADNWHIDKLKISITKNDETKILVDRAGAPIHIFAGDTRIKKFIVE